MSYGGIFPILVLAFRVLLFSSSVDICLAVFSPTALSAPKPERGVMDRKGYAAALLCDAPRPSPHKELA